MGNFLSKLGKFVLVVVVGLVALWILAPFSIVPPGHRGVMTTLGSVSEAVNHGTRHHAHGICHQGRNPGVLSL